MACQKVTIFNCDGTELASLEPSLEEHGNPVGVVLVLRDIGGAARVRLEAAAPQFGGPVIRVMGGSLLADGPQGRYGAAMHSADPFEGKEGGLLVLSASTDSPDPLPDGSGPPKAIVLDASERSIVIRGEGGEPVVVLGRVQAGGDTELHMGGPDGAGLVTIWNEDCRAHIRLTAKNLESDVTLYSFRVSPDESADPNNATIRLNGQDGHVIVGGKKTTDASGELSLRINGDTTIHMEAFASPSYEALIELGGNGTAGTMRLFPTAATPPIGETIKLDGQRGEIYVDGDIVLRNADCAEDFLVANWDETDPGTVVVIDDGKLRPSALEYDRRVAGVVSGASNWRPGIVLGRDSNSEDSRPIALSGRTYCKADATQARIRVGDLLTTSSTPGHAMRASEPRRSFGACIGKALEALDDGRGMIPVLVALQ